MDINRLGVETQNMYCMNHSRRMRQRQIPQLGQTICAFAEQHAHLMPCFVVLLLSVDKQMDDMRLEAANRTWRCGCVDGFRIGHGRRSQASEWLIGELKAAVFLSSERCVALEEYVEFCGQHQPEFLDRIQFASQCDSGGG